MDRFFDQVKELLTSFKNATDPYNEARDTLYEATKFYEVPGAKPKHVTTGMFLSFTSLSNGDLDKLKIEFKGDPPFIEIKMDHFGGDVLQTCIDNFNAFKTLV